MQGYAFIVFSLVCLIFYFYGVFLTVQSLKEKNECKMTFMFEYPNYVKINFEENEQFPKYNLYAYAEGQLAENARQMLFSGAPVLFIPGNSGSYKQARSLASVALRKGVDNDWMSHLDYFTVDLNEEYSALYGGVLQEQTLYIEHCIQAILKLYSRLPYKPDKLVIIAHSIGGKLAQKLLTSPNTAPYISTVITLASPMDKPVLNMDVNTYNFYEDIEDYWTENRQIVATKTNNSCCSKARRSAYDQSESRILDDKLLISIGGGNKDLLVHSGLTDSKFSDLHVMTHAMSNVWVSSDHLCIVWCLQLVLVINRFLYSIIEPIKYKSTISKGLSFIDDKVIRLEKAEYYFQSKQPLHLSQEKELNLESPERADWIEDNRRVFTEKFKNGCNKTRIQMIRLNDNELYQSLRVEVVNLETVEWVFGCEAIETNGASRFCSKGVSMWNHTVRIPSELPDRSSLAFDLHEVKRNNPKWTHILLRFAPTREPFQFSVDIHNPSDRQIKVMMPKWYQFSTVKLLEDTVLGSVFYQLNVTGLDETYQALELHVKPKYCNKHHTTGKICVPWTSGFDRFHHNTELDASPMILWTPKSRPINYNTSTHPIIVELNLNPSCRYSISIKNSFGHTLMRIVQQFSHWLPAHLVAVLLLAFKFQISLTPKDEKFKCGSLHRALSTCTPFFVITASRVFLKFVLMAKFLPKPETIPASLTVSIIIHGSALALVTIFTAAFYAGITFWGNVAYKLLFRLVQLPIPMISDFVLSIIEKFPASVAVLLISLAFASCGGISLVIACVVYFILISKMYEDYLEEFVFKTAKIIAKKLFGRAQKSKNAVEVKEATKKVEEPAAKPLIDEVKTKDQEEEKNLNKMLDEAMEKQKEETLKKNKELALARVEYDGVTEGLSAINFHLPIFLLLVIVALLSIPSIITWAKNYQYSAVLTPDPTLIPATIILVALGFLWQLQTPRNVMGYKIISGFFYMGAILCVLYCQDSVFRLSYIIAGTFTLITLHQLLAPKDKELPKEEAPADFLDDLKTNYDRIKTVKGFVKK